MFTRFISSCRIIEDNKLWFESIGPTVFSRFFLYFSNKRWQNLHFSREQNCWYICSYLNEWSKLFISKRIMKEKEKFVKQSLMNSDRHDLQQHNTNERMGLHKFMVLSTKRRKERRAKSALAFLLHEKKSGA